MRIEKKNIDIKAAAPILEKLGDAPENESTVSLGKFVAENRDVLARSSKNVREIHEYLKANGLDVGTYHSFRRTCYRAGLRRRSAKVPAASQKPMDNLKARVSVEPNGQQKPQQARRAPEAEEQKARVSKYNPALPPIYLPGGVEAIIDPETGAKHFEIKSKYDS
jgi:hypothetical protein